MSESVVLVERVDEVAVVSLNRPDALNALSTGLRRGLVAAFEALAEDDSVRVIVLTGNGRAFCAGVDLKELGRTGTQAAAGSRSGEPEPDLMQAMLRLPQPVIGAINGFAITGGFEIALACDVLIASTQAQFADTHARVGILPGWGLSQRLARAIGIYRAKELSLTGNFLGAEKAYEWGLVSQVVEPGELRERSLSLAAEMLSCEPASLAGYKKVIDEGFALAFGDGMEREAAVSRAHSAGVRASDVAVRRSGIQQRGRQQTRRE